MVSKQLTYNAQDIRRELDWLKAILRCRSDLNAGKPVAEASVFDILPPELEGSPSAYARFVQDHEMGFTERFLLILAAVPDLQPELLDVFIQKNKNTQQLYTEFGGRLGNRNSGFLPTGETVMFVLAANDLARRFQLQSYFEGDHFFAKEQILWLEEGDAEEPALSGRLMLSREVLDLITTSRVRKPRFSSQFPAHLLTTSMEWDDLVLNDYTLRQVEEIENWLLHYSTLMEEWQMGRILKPGYKALFYGPPGTGKSLTAALLGKKLEQDVYRVDLSQMVSKYIGETEKNLSRVFDKAESKNWILFFDEGDALFGKRTKTQSSHDRYANQQVSYLLQRIEEYDGLVILATNMKNNIDEAFLRRFQSIINFPMPNAEERYRIWSGGLSPKAQLESSIDLQGIAQQYELSGGAIVNVIQYSLLKALRHKRHTLLETEMLEGIKREFLKGGRTV